MMSERITQVEEKFERRLTEEIGKFKAKMYEEIDKLGRAELIQWMFIFWVGQIAVLGGLIIVVFGLGRCMLNDFI